MPLLVVLKLALLWDLAPFSLVKNDRRFRRAYCLHHHPDDGDSKYL
jgi:hypothetical protein